MYNEDTIEPQQRGCFITENEHLVARPLQQCWELVCTGRRVEVDKSNPKDSIVEESNYFKSGKVKGKEYIKRPCKQKVYRK